MIKLSITTLSRWFGISNDLGASVSISPSTHPVRLLMSGARCAKRMRRKKEVCAVVDGVGWGTYAARNQYIFNSKGMV